MNRRGLKGVRFACYRCELGWGAVVASDKGLLEVLLPGAGGLKDEVLQRVAARWPGAEEGDGLATEAAALLSGYFAGKQVTFSLPLDQSRFTPFQKLVYAWVGNIPYGSVRTYGEAAVAIGRAGAARGVGAAMAANPLPIIIPCHRIVGASGRLTGYSAPGGLDTKAWLLRLEGIGVDKAQKIQKGK